MSNLENCKECKSGYECDKHCSVCEEYKDTTCEEHCEDCGIARMFSPDRSCGLHRRLCIGCKHLTCVC